jgi:hypothetical protein
VLSFATAFTVVSSKELVFFILERAVFLSAIPSPFSAEQADSIKRKTRGSLNIIQSSKKKSFNLPQNSSFDLNLQKKKHA